MAVRPCGVFVVESAVFEAAVEDADEAVTEGAECLVVEVAFGASLVVEVSASGTGRDGAEGPLVDGGGEAPVADVASQHDAFGARRPRDGGCPGVVPARLGVGVSVRVVPELAEHPGAEDDTDSWQGTDDVGVWVLLKLVRQLRLESGDLTVELTNDPHGRFCCGGERFGHGGGCFELAGA